MRGFVGGFVLAGVLAAAGFLLVVQPQTDASCDDRCGSGTSCREGSCQADLEPAGAAADPVPVKKKRKRRRSKRRRTGGSAETSGVERVSDAGVPRYDRTKTKVLGESTGSGRLSDRVINRELAKLDPAFQHCIELAAAATDEELPSGRVRYEFGVAPSGSVTGVNARAPRALAELGVVACVRKALHDHRFPSFDGLEMGAEGSFSI
jgi:hypothetical protein